MACSLQERFARLARYSERANVEMYEAASRLTDRARKRDTGSWFGSIHGILNHLLVCNINWLKRYRILAPDSAALHDPQLDPFSESRYCERFEYTDSSGAARSAVACDAFDFSLVHQTHHRGQVSQILDAWGVPNSLADNARFLARDPGARG